MRKRKKKTEKPLNIKVDGGKLTMTGLEFLTEISVEITEQERAELENWVRQKLEGRIYCKSLMCDTQLESIQRPGYRLGVCPSCNLQICRATYK